MVKEVVYDIQCAPAHPPFRADVEPVLRHASWVPTLLAAIPSAP